MTALWSSILQQKTQISLMLTLKSSTVLRWSRIRQDPAGFLGSQPVVTWYIGHSVFLHFLEGYCPIQLRNGTEVSSDVARQCPVKWLRKCYPPLLRKSDQTKKCAMTPHESRSRVKLKWWMCRVTGLRLVILQVLLNVASSLQRTWILFYFWICRFRNKLGPSSLKFMVFW